MLMSVNTFALSALRLSATTVTIITVKYSDSGNIVGLGSKSCMSHLSCKELSRIIYLNGCVRDGSGAN